MRRRTRCLAFLASAASLSVVSCRAVLDGPAEGSHGGSGTGADVLGEADDATTRLHRLTRREFGTTVKAAFPSVSFELDPERLPLDELVAGFSANATALLSASALDQYIAASEEIGAQVAAQEVALIGECEEALAVCLRVSLPPLLRILHRGEPEVGFVDDLAALATTLEASQGRTAALQAVVSRALLSPRFLFKLEFGDGTGKITESELAVRLSYFLWGAPPDAELVELAQQGALRERLPEQVRRLIADERAKERFAGFFEQWLRLDHLAARSAPEREFPGEGDALKASMLVETLSFADEIARKSTRPWRDLFLGDYGYLDETTSGLYGLSTTGEVAGLGRPGIIARAAYLTAHSHAEVSQRIHRGLVVREQLLCEKLPPPPPGVDLAADVDRLSAPSCAGCHKPMEAIGVGFESYDGVGRDRATPSSGTVYGLDDQDVSFSSLAELGNQLAGSTMARECFARQWLRFSLGDEFAKDENVVVSSLAESLAAPNAPLGEFLAVLATSDRFSLLNDPAPGGTCQ